MKFDNKEVSWKMNTARGVVLQPNQYVWPPVTVGQTNFRMAGVAPTPAGASYGHSERLLLSNNDLEKMVLAYKGGHNGNYPSYILFYSTLLPCIRPMNPDGSRRCAQMVIDGDKMLENNDIALRHRFISIVSRNLHQDMLQTNKKQFLRKPPG